MGRVERYRYVYHPIGGCEYDVRKELVDKYFIGDELLERDEASELKKYDLSGFKTPVTDIELAQLVDGLNDQALDIADNPEEQVRLEEFFCRYVKPDFLLHEDPQGVMRTYAASCLSAIGDKGSLIHIRRAQRMQDAAVGSPLNHLVVISHVDDPNGAAVHYATTENIPRYYDSVEMRYDVVEQPQQTTLQAVEHMSPRQLAVARLRGREKATKNRPFVSLHGDDKLYRRSDGHIEPFSDLERMRQRVRTALDRELGNRAVVGLGEIGYTGQYEQKVVV